MKTAREITSKAMIRYERYLNGPVPGDLVYGDPDYDPRDRILDQTLTELREAMERVIGEDEITDGAFADVNKMNGYNNALKIEQRNRLKEWLRE